MSRLSLLAALAMLLPRKVKAQFNKLSTSSGSSFVPILRPIDGGPTYYADNGFTYATNSASNGYPLGWDDHNFFPIGAWQLGLLDQTAANRWNDLGWNFMFNLTSNSSFAVCRANHISVVAYAYEISQELASNRSYG